MLHVTNGDSAVERIRAAGFTDPILPWRDVLHEGPVPEGSPEELAMVRAAFLAEPGSPPPDLAVADRTLVTTDQATLWFEPDLYDQLQLIQILARLKGKQIPTWMVPDTDLLGPAKKARILELWAQRKEVSEEQFELAERAWAAFRSANPAVLPNFMGGDLSALPHLRPALSRLLDDRPSEKDGLARTERQILWAIQAGARKFPKLFAAIQAMEADPFLGDTVVRMWLDRLEKCKTPLIAGPRYHLTEAGKRVLAGEANFAELNGVDRWMGGWHIRILDAEAKLAKMRDDWDQRARENARYYVATCKEEWDEDEFYRSGEQTIAEEVLSDLENICQGRKPGDMKIIEIGCGAGRLTGALARVFGEVHAVDVSGEMVEKARRAVASFPNAHVYQNNGRDLMVLPDGPYDFAFSTIVFQHIPYREVIYSYVREVSRLLRPGALFKFQVQGGTTLANQADDTWVGVTFSDEEAVEMARACGFDPRFRHGHGEQYFWLWFFKK